VKRHEFLRGMHERIAPRSYLEIGVNDGRSLALSRARSIAVDPAFKITTPVHCDLELVKATSDDFFASRNPIDHLNQVIDLAFVDGLHVFEYALRDFMNIERYSSWTSVVIFDDMLPRSISEAARARHTREWTGDVFKVAQVLRRYRPDLVCLALDTQPTGLLLVLGADPGNSTLSEHYEEIVAEFVTQDPQHVAEEILHRTGSADPQLVLEADLWQHLVRAREEHVSRETGLLESLRPLAGTGPTSQVVPPTPVPWPPPKPPAAEKPAVMGRPLRIAWRRTLGKALSRGT
jgi:hypothetical protein